MRTVVVYGQNHKGSTYHIAHELACKLGGETTEFFLPRDFDEFCVGCNTCFNVSEKDCPHYKKLAPLTQAMDEADVIVLASPVYVYHATGAMKAFLDHYGYRWMVHSPDASMFRKQAVCICTAAGAGMRSTLKDMADSLFFWGAARVYKYGVGVAAVNWQGVSQKKREAIDKKTSALAQKIARNVGRVTPRLKTRAAFFAMHLMQRKGFNPRDVEHWKQQGWTEGVRPWKS
ncbi:MAG: NAD(P)H-dependent oxidoreductase [Atopobiaceae bacterium]|nr:NAD(P)H-dependent oxidoreductase [Atopobiaceae bacterium]